MQWNLGKMQIKFFVVSTSGDAAGIINTINEGGYHCEEFTD